MDVHIFMLAPFMVVLIFYQKFVFGQNRREPAKVVCGYLGRNVGGYPCQIVAF